MCTYAAHKGQGVPVHALKIHGGGGAVMELHSLPMVLDTHKWSVSHPDHFTPKERIPTSNWIQFSIGPKDDVDVCPATNWIPATSPQSCHNDDEDYPCSPHCKHNFINYMAKVMYGKSSFQLSVLLLSLSLFTPHCPMGSYTAVCVLGSIQCPAKPEKFKPSSDATDI